MNHSRKLLAALLALSILAAGCGRESSGNVTSHEESISSSAPSESVESSSSQEEPSSAVDKEGWHLRLVNPTHALEKELDIELTEIGGYKFDARIADAVNALLAAAQEDGVSLAIISGYRTMDRSRTLYTNKVQEYLNAGYPQAEAEAEAAKWVAPPGTSEHHTGLAMDIVSGDYYTKYSDLVEAFENEPEAVWLRENCARFGFILRFPKDKEKITGIHYEPWHFRYVGVEAAQEIMDKGLCLEEYLGET